MHRNHDKIFTGKTGNCEHENVKGKKDGLMKADFGSSLFGSGNLVALLKKN